MKCMLSIPVVLDNLVPGNDLVGWERYVSHTHPDHWPGVHSGSPSHSNMILTECHRAAAHYTVEEAAPATNNQEIL